ncbi:protein of unknown function (plasmid) [Methylocella tundrae]|uniref:Uncharacterized protein n=1 Tax=Methylocella tundrae TaxID=227605 RepID=A0A4U8Z7H6_METTU|nr:protein of unknown function [Methylocella tundrae]
MNSLNINAPSRTIAPGLLRSANASARNSLSKASFSISAGRWTLLKRLLQRPRRIPARPKTFSLSDYTPADARLIAQNAIETSAFRDPSTQFNPSFPKDPRHDSSRCRSRAHESGAHSRYFNAHQMEFG